MRICVAYKHYRGDKRALDRLSCSVVSPGVAPDTEGSREHRPHLISRDGKPEEARRWTRAEHLLQAIKQAMANGLSQQYFEDFVLEECMNSWPMALRGLLFGREFAQAPFGTDLMEWKVGGYRMLDPDGRPVRVPACEFHLQQMALSAD